MDLGEVKPIRAVSSWSHDQAGKRGAQRLRIFGSDSEKDPGWKTANYTELGTIDTTRQASSKYTGASLRAGEGKNLGTYRWVLWSVSPVTSANENTAYQELAVEIGK
jgi:hypothetical protein